MNLGFEGLLAANIHLDLLGLGFRLFGEFDLQQALIIVGAHLPRIYRTGERERAGKASVLPLDATEVLLFLFLLDLALAMDGDPPPPSRPRRVCGSILPLTVSPFTVSGISVRSVLALKCRSGLLSFLFLLGD